MLEVPQWVTVHQDTLLPFLGQEQVGGQLVVVVVEAVQELEAAVAWEVEEVVDLTTSLIQAHLRLAILESSALVCILLHLHDLLSHLLEQDPTNISLLFSRPPFCLLHKGTLTQEDLDLNPTTPLLLPKQSLITACLV